MHVLAIVVNLQETYLGVELVNGHLMGADVPGVDLDVAEPLLPEL